MQEKHKGETKQMEFDKTNRLRAQASSEINLIQQPCQPTKGREMK